MPEDSQADFWSWEVHDVPDLNLNRECESEDANLNTGTCSALDTLLLHRDSYCEVNTMRWGGKRNLAN